MQPDTGNDDEYEDEYDGEQAGTSPCFDCGHETTPGPDADGADQRWEYYAVRNDIWARAVADDDVDYLCVACLERRLGRRLKRSDFTNAIVNALSPQGYYRDASWAYRTARLSRRLGRRGKQE